MMQTILEPPDRAFPAIPKQCCRGGGKPIRDGGAVGVCGSPRSGPPTEGILKQAPRVARILEKDREYDGAAKAELAVEVNLRKAQKEEVKTEQGLLSILSMDPGGGSPDMPLQVEEVKSPDPKQLGDQETGDRKDGETGDVRSSPKSGMRDLEKLVSACNMGCASSVFKKTFPPMIRKTSGPEGKQERVQQAAPERKEGRRHRPGIGTSRTGRSGKSRSKKDEQEGQ